MNRCSDFPDKTAALLASCCERRLVGIGEA
jgi:hypothetical protein